MASKSLSMTWHLMVSLGSKWGGVLNSQLWRAWSPREGVWSVVFHHSAWHLMVSLGSEGGEGGGGVLNSQLWHGLQVLPNYSAALLLAL